MCSTSAALITDISAAILCVFGKYFPAASQSTASNVSFICMFIDLLLNTVT